MKNNIKSIKSISSMLLANEAIKRGIKVEHINNYQEGMAFLELSYKNHFEYIVGQDISKTSAPASYAEKNKALAKSLLSREKISVAKGKLFHKNKTNEIYKFIKEIGYPVVIKPFNGAHGNLVFIGLRNKKDCDTAIKKIFQENNYILVEKEFKGKEYRIISTRNKFLAATYRDPANVIGDGAHSIRELIKIKNSDPRRGDSSLSIFVKIKIDNIVKCKLVDAKVKLEDILPAEKKLYLRYNSNISTGGDSIDITDQIHSDFKKIAVKAIRAIPGLSYGGIDLMSNQDISKKPTKKSYIVLEINSSPGISLQHYPFKGKSRDVAKEIIDVLFPEIKN